MIRRSTLAFPLLGLWLLSGCGETPPSPTAVSDLETVQAVQVERKNLQRTTTQPATIYPDHQAEIFARVSGYLQELKPKVDIGKTVSKDEVLAVIDVPEMKKSIEKQLATINRLKAEQQKVEALELLAQVMIKVAQASIKEAKAHLA